MPTQEYYIGQREQISWGEESTYGTAVTPTEVVGKDAEFLNPQMSQNWQPIMSAGRDNREIETQELGAKTIRFQLRFIATTWEFLKYTTHGNVSTSGSNPYTHTLSLSSTVKSFTLERAKRGNPNHVETYTGCVFTSVTINFQSGDAEGEGFVEVTAEVLGQDNQSPTTTVSNVSFPSKKGFQFHHVKLTIDGSEVVEVNSGQITIDNNIDETDSRYANTNLNRTIGDPIPKTASYTFNFNVNIHDGTFYDLWNSASAISGSSQIEFIRGSNDYAKFVFAGDTFMEEAFSQTDYNAPTNSDLVGSDTSINIEVQDDISSY